MIDERKLLEKLVTWRRDFAHAELARGPSVPLNAEPYARGQYHGVMLVEQWVQEIINQQEQEEKSSG